MRRPISVLVVDDEPYARGGLIDLLAARPEFAVVGECSNGRSAVRAIRARRPDVVLLDVQMPEMDGFAVIRAVGAAAMPLVVFVTAFDQFAIEAFTVHALDYVLKPVGEARLNLALNRVKKALTDASDSELGRRLLGLLDDLSHARADTAAGEALTKPAADPARYLSRFLVKSGDRMRLVRTEDVVWIEAASYYVKLHTRFGSFLIRRSMRSLESRLDPTRFFRVHRSAIANLDHVRELSQARDGTHRAILNDGTRVKLSRRRWPLFAARLGG